MYFPPFILTGGDRKSKNSYWNWYQERMVI